MPSAEPRCRWFSASHVLLSGGFLAGFRFIVGLFASLFLVAFQNPGGVVVEGLAAAFAADVPGLTVVLNGNRAFASGNHTQSLPCPCGGQSLAGASHADFKHPSPASPGLRLLFQQHRPANFAEPSECQASMCCGVCWCSKSPLVALLADFRSDRVGLQCEQPFGVSFLQSELDYCRIRGRSDQVQLLQATTGFESELQCRGGLGEVPADVDGFGSGTIIRASSQLQHSTPLAGQFANPSHVLNGSVASISGGCSRGLPAVFIGRCSRYGCEQQAAGEQQSRYECHM